MEIWHFNKYFERKYFKIKTSQGWWDNVYEKMTFYGLAKLKSFKLFVSDDDDNDGWLQKANEARVFVAEFQNVITTKSPHLMFFKSFLNFLLHFRTAISYA